MPCDFDQFYKCDNCRQNHIEEECPRPYYRNPNVQHFYGKQRLGHIDTKRESIEGEKLNVINKNNHIADEEHKLANGYQFCNCCAYLIAPDNVSETVIFHSCSVSDIGPPGEDYSLTCYGYACCLLEQGAPGCVVHTHTFI